MSSDTTTAPATSTILNNAKQSSEDQSFIEPKSAKPKNIRKDLHHIVFLIYLYFLQGVPLGLVMSTSTLLASSKTSAASFSDQGTFSFAFYPFSVKLLWAPIVDSLFISRVGRRKTWLFLVQFLMCLFMFASAGYVQELVENNQKSSGKNSLLSLLVKIKIKY